MEEITKHVEDNYKKNIVMHTYVVIDYKGRQVLRYEAENKPEALKKFKADTENYRKYGYFGKLCRWYQYGERASSGRWY